MLIDRKLVVALLSVLMLILAGCKEKRLTLDECKAIRDHELKYMRALLSPGAVDPISSNGVSDKAVASCVSGEVYTRKDYQCIVSAKTNLVMSECMAQAHEKAGR